MKVAKSKKISGSEKHFVRICPQCGSTDIKIPGAGFDMRMSIQDMCQNCGNIGNFPEVEISQIANFRKKIKK